MQERNRDQCIAKVLECSILKHVIHICQGNFIQA